MHAIAWSDALGALPAPASNDSKSRSQVDIWNTRLVWVSVLEENGVAVLPVDSEHVRLSDNDHSAVFFVLTVARLGSLIYGSWARRYHGAAGSLP